MKTQFSTAMDFFNLAANVLAFVMYLILHFWTVYIAWTLNGFIASFVSLIIPFAPSVWYFLEVLRNEHSLTAYTLMILTMIGVFVFGGLCRGAEEMAIRFNGHRQQN